MSRVLDPTATPLLGRAKDLGSAAVMLTLALATTTWFVVLWHEG